MIDDGQLASYKPITVENLIAHFEGKSHRSNYDGLIADSAVARNTKAIYSMRYN